MFEETTTGILSQTMTGPVVSTEAEKQTALWRGQTFSNLTWRDAELQHEEAESFNFWT